VSIPPLVFIFIFFFFFFFIVLGSDDARLTEAEEEGGRPR